MDRRKFFKAGTIIGAGGLLLSPTSLFGNHSSANWKKPAKKPKNIIFLVSDGMSSGTLTMADLYSQRKYGKKTNWINLLENNNVKRALMDTSAANSLITDSAAGGSAWGGGVKVPNGKLNMGANGEEYTPILQKFKAAGKSVGCVTSVPITHATPASFCVTKKHRSLQEEIAEDYLKLRFDVMLGSGKEYFASDKRKDGKDLLEEFKKAGYFVAEYRSDLKKDAKNKPVIGVFEEGSLPYYIDHKTGINDFKETPSLAELSVFALNELRKNENGFVLQIEGGKVDWAAHANDTTAILEDQIAFDEAVGVALGFAESSPETLVIITTDHGNANPGLFYGKNADKNFEKLLSAKHSNEWVLRQVNKDTTSSQLIDLVEFASNLAISKEESELILTKIKTVQSDGLYNPYKLPFGDLAKIQAEYSNVHWAYSNHSADYVELTMFGAGSDILPSFIQNSELHHYMLHVAEVAAK